MEISNKGCPSGICVRTGTLLSSFINDTGSGTECTSASSQMTPSWVVQSVCSRPEMPSRWTWTGSRSGTTQEVQKGQVQGPAPGSGRSPLLVQNGGWMDGDQPCEEGLGNTDRWKIRYDGNVCLQPGKPVVSWAASPAAWAQGEGGDSAPLPRSAETPPGVLRPALEPWAQDRPGAVGAGPEEAPATIRGLEERLGELRLFSLGKRRLWGDLIAAFQCVKGGLQERQWKTFYQGL